MSKTYKVRISDSMDGQIVAIADATRHSHEFILNWALRDFVNEYMDYVVALKRL